MGLLRQPYRWKLATLLVTAGLGVCTTLPATASVQRVQLTITPKTAKHVTKRASSLPPTKHQPVATKAGKPKFKLIHGYHETRKAQRTARTAANDTLTTDEQAAKRWIAFHESSYRYDAQNGQYYGRYQLSRTYLKGDFSAANQERTANRYVAQRYGSWTAAKRFWLQHHWY